MTWIKPPSSSYEADISAMWHLLWISTYTRGIPMFRCCIQWSVMFSFQREKEKGFKKRQQLKDCLGHVSSWCFGHVWLKYFPCYMFVGGSFTRWQMRSLCGLCVRSSVPRETTLWGGCRTSISRPFSDFWGIEKCESKEVVHTFHTGTSQCEFICSKKWED